MNLQQAMRALESKGTAQNRKVYARHGYPQEMFGVSFTELRALAKSVGVDQGLATALWNTGNADARILATLVMDPAQMDGKQWDAWVQDITFQTLADQLAGPVARSPFARAKAEQWTQHTKDHVAQTGWNVVSLLAADATTDRAWLEQHLDRIENTIHGAGNWTRHAMNQALISIGGYCPPLQDKALAMARRIGKVDVDHGETGCKTPDAQQYIAKMVAHQSKQKPTRVTRSKRAPSSRAAV